MVFGVLLPQCRLGQLLELLELLSDRWAGGWGPGRRGGGHGEGAPPSRRISGSRCKQQSFTTPSPVPTLPGSGAPDRYAQGVIQVLAQLGHVDAMLLADGVQRVRVLFTCSFFLCCARMNSTTKFCTLPHPQMYDFAYLANGC